MIRPTYRLSNEMNVNPFDVDLYAVHQRQTEKYEIYIFFADCEWKKMARACA